MTVLALSAAVLQVLAALEDLGTATYKQWEDCAGVSHAEFYRYTGELIEAGRVIKDGTGYRSAANLSCKENS